VKTIDQITCCVVDYGSFPCLAEMMATKCKRVIYHSPFEEEYRNLHDCIIGDGIERIDRTNEHLDFMDPKILKEIDLFLFPDIWAGGLQRYLRSIGKLVWGSMGASDLELYRTLFLRTIRECGLPVAPSTTILGVTNLAAFLKDKEDKWVKINRYRENMETFHWQDWTHGQRKLELLAYEFGPFKEQVMFVVQDTIETDIEIGYDGWCIDGKFPAASFQGFEKKNELYLGSLLDYDEQPEQVREVNEKFGPVLSRYGYRNFFASEIRVLPDTFFFTDPTNRMAGQTQEHLTSTCTNLPEVILAGAQGEVIKPEYRSKFVAEATMHYTDDAEGWKTLRISKEARDHCKLYHYCIDGEGVYQFPPHKIDEVGVICGGGDSVEEAFEALKANFELLKGEPVRVEIRAFADLLEAIEASEEAGLKFSDEPLPGPEIATN
jgi:hypothetical protein